jgi:hypothetical protein
MGMRARDWVVEWEAGLGIWDSLFNDSEDPEKPIRFGSRKAASDYLWDYMGEVGESSDGSGNPVVTNRKEFRKEFRIVPIFRDSPYVRPKLS